MADVLANLALDAAGNISLPSPSDMAALLPPEFLQTVSGGLGAVQGAMGLIQGAQPAIALVDTISSGKAPDPQAIIGAMSATVAMVNPVAGAIVGAAGELAVGMGSAAESLFRSLGLISPPPVTYPFRGGIRNGQPIPPGRDSTYPKWQPWDSFARGYLWNPDGLPYEFQWQHVLSVADAASGARDAPMTNLLFALNRYGEVAGDKNGKGYRIGPNGRNDFERFFFEMLKKDIENWWNANPSVAPRKLLLGAVAIWNHLHAPAPKASAGMRSVLGAVGVTQGDITYAAEKATQGGQGDPISWILSQWGDIDGVGQVARPVTVNMGPRIVVRAPVDQAAAARTAAGAASSASAAAIARFKAKGAARPGAPAATHAGMAIPLGLAAAAVVLLLLLKGQTR